MGWAWPGNLRKTMEKEMAKNGVTFSFTTCRRFPFNEKDIARKSKVQEKTMRLLQRSISCYEISIVTIYFVNLLYIYI